MSTEVRVDCYAGYKANQRPLAFSLGRKKIKITYIRDQWYGPDHTYFKVLAEDKNTYILRYSEVTDCWDLVLFEEKDYRGDISTAMGKDASA